MDPSRTRSPTATLAGCFALATAMALGAVSPGLAGGQEPAPQPVRPPRFAEVWIGGPLDSVYNAEYARLQEACAPADAECFATELDTTALPLAPVWSDTGAVEPAGRLTAALRPRGRWPYATLRYHPDDGPAITIREDVGDWGYGVTLPLADTAAGWLRLTVPGAATPVWIPADARADGFGVVEVYGLEGRLWRLGPVIGTDDGTGETAELPAGVYLVLDVSDGQLRLRPELPGDMPCGADPEPPVDPTSAPVYSVPLDRLQDADGLPAVEPAYPKGC